MYKIKIGDIRIKAFWIKGKRGAYLEYNGELPDNPSVSPERFYGVKAKFNLLAPLGEVNIKYV